MVASTTPLLEPGGQDAENAFRAALKTIIRTFSYALICVIILGCVGNFLSVVVFIRERKQDRTSAQYLGLLACIDLINLGLFGVPDWLVGSLSLISDKSWSFDSMVGTELGCRAWMYAWHVSVFMSSWIVTLFSLERMLITWSPLKWSVYFSSGKPRKRAMISMLVFAVIVFLGAFDWSGLMDVVDEHTTEDYVRQGCFIRLDIPIWELLLASVLTYGFNSGIPCCLVAVFNILILVGIRRNRFDKSKSTKNESRCTKNLILVSFFFFLFMTPSTVILSVDTWYHIVNFPGFTERDIADFHDVVLLLQALNYCNFAVNPLLYTLCLPFYREELKKMFPFRRRA